MLGLAFEDITAPYPVQRQIYSTLHHRYRAIRKPELKHERKLFHLSFKSAITFLFGGTKDSNYNWMSWGIGLDGDVGREVALRFILQRWDDLPMELRTYCKDWIIDNF